MGQTAAGGPLPGLPSGRFLPRLWRMGDGSSPSPTLAPAQKFLLPLAPPQEAKEGEGWGGRAPLGTAVAQSISPKPRNFFITKKKKEKKKKNPAATFPPCPIGTVETGSVGFPGRVAQGWNTLRQEWWSSRSGPPPGPLRAYLPLLPSSPPPLQATTRGGLPLPSSPWAAPHPSLLSWALPSRSCCGDIRSPPQVCAIFTPLVEGPDPRLEEGRGPQGAPAPRPPAGILHSGRAFVCKHSPSRPSSQCYPSLALIRAPACPAPLSSRPRLLRTLSPSSQETLPRASPGSGGRAMGWGQDGRSDSQLANLRGQCGSGWLWALGWWRPLHPLIYFSAVSVLEKLRGGSCRGHPALT